METLAETKDRVMRSYYVSTPRVTGCISLDRNGFIVRAWTAPYFIAAYGPIWEICASS